MEHATEPYIFPNLIINSTGNIGNSEITAFQQNKGYIQWNKQATELLPLLKQAANHHRICVDIQHVTQQSRSDTTAAAVMPIKHRQTTTRYVWCTNKDNIN